MSLHDTTHWVQTEPGRLATPLRLDQVYTWGDDLMASRTMFIVRDRDAEEAKGLCFIFGRRMNMHFIGNANHVRYQPSQDYGFFIYPYNPDDIGLVLTRYVAIR